MYNLIIFKKLNPTPTLSTRRGSFFLFAIVIMAWTLSSCTTSFYIVRHAEKSASPKEDPLLTVEGSQRAERLKTILENKGIEKVYSTKTVRTMTTGKPLADAQKLEIEIYEPKNQSTIRHIINGLSEKEFLKKDLEDAEYSHLYLVKRGKLRKPRVKVEEF